MFIRKKPNKSGTVSVQVVKKNKARKQRVVKSFGSARQEVAGPALPHIYEEEDVIDGFINSLNNVQVQVVGPELVFGTTLYDRIGYGAIGNRMFRNIVICRLFNPGSKLRTVDYMERYLHVTYSVDQIYHFLDNLCYRNDKGKKACDDSKDDTVKDGKQYILGARPKSENDKVKERILSLDMKYGDVVEIKKDGDMRLVLSYTEKRARKDAHNR